MKKLLLTLAAVVITLSCYAFPKALYVVKDNSFSKFNFGVAEDLKFSENGRFLIITGYSEKIDLNEIDYITFTAPTTTALTPDEQKQRLIDIARKVNDMVDINQEADMVNLITDFLAEGGRQPDNEYEWCEPVSNYAWPAGFWGEKNKQSSLKSMMEAILGIVKHEGNNGAPLLASALNLYRFADYTGIFQANNQTQKWEQTGTANYLELRYRRTNHVMEGNYGVRLTASDDYYTYGTSDFNCEIPRKLTITFMKNSEQLATTTIDFDVLQDDHINAEISFKGQSAKALVSIKISDDLMETTSTAYAGGKYLNRSYAKVNANGLMDYDTMKDDYDASRDYYDDTTYTEVEGDKARLARHFQKAYAESDVINELQATGYLFDYKNFITALDDADKTPDMVELTYPDGYVSAYWPQYYIDYKDGIIELAYTQQELRDKAAKYLNTKCDIQFAYDNTGKTQGFFAWEGENPYNDYESYYPTENIPGYGYYVKNGMAFRIDLQEYYEEVPPTPENPSPTTIIHRFYGEKEWTDNGEVIHEFPKDQLVFPVLERTYEYTTTPKLVFSDLTSFMFDEFFTKAAFQNPVNDFNSLIDAFYTITGLERNTEY